MQAYAQSLFERLQRGGHGGTLLSVQYRMNPAISAWPTAQFYASAVVDALNVPREPPFAEGQSSDGAFEFQLGAYRFLDLAAGKEQRSQANSIYNGALPPLGHIVPFNRPAPRPAAAASLLSAYG